MHETGFHIVPIWLHNAAVDKKVMVVQNLGAVHVLRLKVLSR